MATAYTWFQPTTETPAVDSTEIWEIYNITGEQTILRHNGATGVAPEISNIRDVTATAVGSEYFENAPKDMVTALPGDPDGTPATGQLVRVKTEFNKPGRYVWHCHILSHEDHEMRLSPAG